MEAAAGEASSELNEAGSDAKNLADGVASAFAREKDEADAKVLEHAVSKIKYFNGTSSIFGKQNLPILNICKSLLNQ